MNKYTLKVYHFLTKLAKKFPKYKKFIYKYQSYMLTGVKKPTNIPVPDYNLTTEEAEKQIEKKGWERFKDVMGIQ